MRRIYNKIEQIVGNVITVIAEDVSYGELAKITTAEGSSIAQVIRLEGDRVSLQVLAGTRGMSTNAEINFLGHSMKTPCRA